jgi:small-conductance mechanosensitive channel
MSKPKHEQNLIQVLTNQRDAAMNEAAHLAANLLTLQEAFSLYRKQQEEKVAQEKAAPAEDLTPLAQQMMMDDML